MTPTLAVSMFPRITVQGIATLCGFGRNMGEARKALDEARLTLQKPINQRLYEGRLKVACQAAGADLRRVATPSGAALTHRSGKIPKEAAEKHDVVRGMARGLKVTDLSEENVRYEAYRAFEDGHFEEYPERRYHPQVKAIDNPPPKTNGHGFRHSRARMGINRRANDARGSRVGDGVV